MKILLIDPPFERLQGIKRGFFPLGLASVGAYLKRLGHDVLIYDAELGNETSVSTYSDAAHNYEKFLLGLKNPDHPIWLEIESEIKNYAPQIVGITCPTVKYESALIIAGLVKKNFPNTYVVFGGCHPSALPDQVLANPQIDFVVRGEGEVSCAELIDAIASNGNLANISGISYKNEGKIFHNSDRQLIENMDTLPFPGRELLLNDKKYPSEDLGLLMGSRGCPFACTYCASNNMWHRKVRYRSVANIIEEIKQVQENYGTCQFSFEDDSFTCNQKIIKEFCREVKSQGLKFSWSAITRINLLTAEMIQLMREAGCNHLRVGIETGSEKILKDTQKGLTLDEMRRGAKLLHEQGMYWSAYFMIGLPTETEQDILDTINFMSEIKPDYATLSIFTPYPGTAIFDDLYKSGKIDKNIEWSRFSHASPYNNFAQKIAPERFAQLVEFAAGAVDKHNSNFMRLLKRARAKGSVYMQKPSELGKDLNNYLVWKKKL